MTTRRQYPVALTVAGSDSGGGAGIQADLLTYRACGVFGTSATTCVTAQNPARVSAIEVLSPQIVAEQIERVFEAFDVGAAKTGMLYDAAVVRAVADAFRRRKFKNLIVDPVMTASSGKPLLKNGAISVLTDRLFPLAALVTPNRTEAELLWRRRIRSLYDLREAAKELAERFGVPVLVKGGHLPQAKQAVDVLFDGKVLHEYGAPFVTGIRTHGTGCVFSAAIAANLALGHGLVGSVARAKRFVTRAIRNATRVGQYHVLRL